MHIPTYKGDWEIWFVVTLCGQEPSKNKEFCFIPKEGANSLFAVTAEQLEASYYLSF